MAGKGGLVHYTNLTATNAEERAVLKQKINAIIDAASTNITVQAMVEAMPRVMIEEILLKVGQIKKDDKS